MEKRKLISLRAVLLGYLVQTAVSCIVAAVLWFLLFLLCIHLLFLLLKVQDFSKLNHILVLFLLVYIP